MLYNAHNRHPEDMRMGNPLAEVDQEDFFTLSAHDKVRGDLGIRAWLTLSVLTVAGNSIVLDQRMGP